MCKVTRQYSPSPLIWKSRIVISFMVSPLRVGGGVEITSYPQGETANDDSVEAA